MTDTPSSAPDPAPATAAGAAGRYRKILLKVSGEVLMGARSYGIDMDVVGVVASEIKEVIETGVEV